MARRTVDSSGCTISYVSDGPPNAPALLLSNSIGTTRDLWTRQLEAFSSVYRVIRYDTRGHGDSDVPEGEYSLDQLGRDVLAILDAEGIASAHVCGLSLGGITAQWLAVHAPHRIAGLVLCNTAARLGSVESWTERIALVQNAGMSAVAERAVSIWFSPAFRDRDRDTVHSYRAMLQSCEPLGYAGCCAALRDADLRDAITTIRCPTLVVGGRSDKATSLEAAEFLRDQVPGATLVALDAGHLSNVESAAEFTATVMDFLGQVERV